MYALDDHYDAAFFESNLREGLQHSRWFVPLVMRLFNPKSVLDVGCGCGHFLDGFAKCGVKTMGLEGSTYAVKHAIHPTVCYWDLRMPLSETTLCNYDLAICIEVAEHIEEDYADILVDTLTKSPLVIMTAAVPGQGGTCHVNEQDWPYWAEKFTARKFALQADLVEQMMRGIEDARQSGEHVAGWWRNAMVFRRYE